MQHNVQYTTPKTLKIVKQLIYRQTINSGTVFFQPIKFQFYYLTGKKYILDHILSDLGHLLNTK